MYYVNYDEASGIILGVYSSDWNIDEVPTPNITISEEEYQHLDNKIVKNGALHDNELENVSPLPIESIQDTYNDKFTRLKEAYVGASILEDKLNITDIQRDYRRMLSKFREAMQSVEGGSSGTYTEHEHCEVCGTILDDGICPNCHWRK